MSAEQLNFFASLDFPGRTTLLVWEIARRLGVSDKHLFNEIDRGALSVIELKAKLSSRRCARVPVECYRDYVLSRLSAPIAERVKFLRDLPESTRAALIVELYRTMPAASRAALLRQLREALAA